MLPTASMVRYKGLRKLLRKINANIPIFYAYSGTTIVDMPTNLMANRKLIAKYYTKRGYKVKIDKTTYEIMVSWH